MSRLDYLMQLPWVEPLGWTLVHFLWQGGVIGIGVWLLLRLMHLAAPQTRHAVAVAGMLACVAAPLATFIALVREPEPPQVTEAVVPQHLASSSETAPPKVVVSPRKFLQIQQAHQKGETVLQEPNGAVSIGLPQQPEEAAAEPEVGLRSVLPWCVGGWFLGVLIASARLLGGWWRVRGWRKQAKPVGAAMAWAEETFSRLRERLGVRRRVRLLLSPDAVGPLAMGVLRPVVIIPASLLAQLPPEHLEAILLHELAHIRRHDYLVNLLQSVAEALLFYHPAVWWLGREVRQTREECCDAMAATATGRGVYARALASLEELRVSGGGLAPAARGGSLLARLRRLLGQPEREAVWSRRNAAWLGSLLAAVVMAGVLVFSTAFAGEDDEKIAQTLPAPSGIVLDTAGKPVAGARVWVYYERSRWKLENRVVEETVSGGDGRFTLRQPLTFQTWRGSEETDHYVVFASKEGRAGAGRVLTGGQPQESIRLQLSTPKPQSFKVVDGEGKPLEGARVWLRSGGGKDHAFSTATDSGLASGLTDASGRVTLAALPAGERSIAASKEGYEELLECVTNPEGVGRYVLKRAATLEGRVLDPLGMPVAGAEVQLYPKFRWHQYFVARTDATGYYRITGIWSQRREKDWGRYEVNIRHPRFVLSGAEVAFAPGEEKRGHDLRVTPGTVIKGTLVDAQTAKPVAGSPVEVRQEGISGFKVWSDEKGHFTFTLPEGEFHLITEGAPLGFYAIRPMMSSGYRNIARGKELIITAPTAGTIRPLGEIHGRILLPDGQPAVAAKLSAFFAEGMISTANERRTGQKLSPTDAEGRFRQADLPVGSAFGLYVESADRKAGGVIAAAVHDPAQPLHLTLRPLGAVAIPVLDGEGKPVPGFEAQVEPDLDGVTIYAARRKVKSNRQGVIRFAHLIPGMRYRLSRQGEDRVTRTWRTLVLLPEAGAPAVSALFVDDRLIVSAKSANGQPVKLEKVKEVVAEVQREGKTSRVMNYGDRDARRVSASELSLPREAFSSAVVGAEIEFKLELEGGRFIQAKASFPPENAERIEVIIPEIFLAQRTEPDPTIPDIKPSEFVGRVLDPAGKPLAGVEVFAEQQIKPKRSVQTDREGVFRLPSNLPAGSTWFPMLRLEKEGYASVTLADNPPGEAFKVSLRNDSHLKGRLRDLKGRPAGETTITLRTELPATRRNAYRPVVSDVITTLTTDPEGRYDALLEPGTYRYEVQTESAGFLRGEFVLAGGETQALPEKLEKGVAVTFTAIDVDTGKPAPGLKVWVMDYTGTNSMAPRQGSFRTTDAQGIARWESLMPGETRFSSHCDGSWMILPGEEIPPYRRWWCNEGLEKWQRIDEKQGKPQGSAGANGLRFNLQSDLQATVKVERGVQVSGVVLDHEGKPVPGMIVAPAVAGVYLLNSEHYLPQTDAEGRFRGYLPAGNGSVYSLYATPPSYQPDVAAKYSSAVSEPFESKPGDHLKFELRLPQGGIITGRVVDEQGNPVAGLEVRAEAVDQLDAGEAWRRAPTGADGRFKIRQVRPGKHVFSLWKNGSSRSDSKLREQVVTVTSGDTTDAGDMIYRPR